MPEPISLPQPWPGDPTVFEHLRRQAAADLPPMGQLTAGIMQMASTTDEHALADPLERIQAVLADLPPTPTPPAAIRLTQQQMAAIPRAEGPTPAWAAYTGTPIEIVTEVVESTPWIEGWIRCPYCRTPAKAHPGETPCGAVLAARGQDVVVVPPLPDGSRTRLDLFEPDRFYYLRQM